jgi:UDP-N-acetylglucosamine 2-epimerase
MSPSDPPFQGGAPKEAFFYRMPCVTVREETEWVETVETSWNVLAGCEPERILTAIRAMRRASERPAPHGDGRAVEQIVALVARISAPGYDDAAFRASKKGR